MPIRFVIQFRSEDDNQFSDEETCTECGTHYSYGTESEARTNLAYCQADNPDNQYRVIRRVTVTTDTVLPDRPGCECTETRCCYDHCVCDEHCWATDD